MDILSQVKYLVDALPQDPKSGTCPYTQGSVVFCKEPYCEDCIIYIAYKFGKE